MKCLILAAGYATRLYPLTENFPKPLLKIGERTILDWLIDDIATCDLVDEFIIISNHRFASHFQQWADSKLNTQHSKLSILDDGTSTNDTRLGAVRDIELAIKHVTERGDSPADGYLVIAGDNVLDFSLTRFIQYAQQKATSCIMRFHEPAHERLLKCGVVTIDADDLVTEMTEKSPTPATHWACPPFYYYTAKDAQLVTRGIEQGCGTDAPGSYIAWLCKQVPVHAMLMPGHRYDIGNLQSYEEVQRTYKGITK